jgi:hypothetical protein
MPETTETPTLTLTPSATPTPTPTPDFYIEVTTEAGYAGRVSREVSVADIWIILLLITILFSMWLMFFAVRLRR